MRTMRIGAIDMGYGSGTMYVPLPYVLNAFMEQQGSALLKQPDIVLVDFDGRLSYLTSRCLILPVPPPLRRPTLPPLASPVTASSSVPVRVTTLVPRAARLLASACVL